MGADGNVTISGFDLSTDKIIILGSGIANGYDSRFETRRRMIILLMRLITKQLFTSLLTQMVVVQP